MQVESAADIASANRLIFPGVGAFGQAMRILQKRGYVQALKDYITVRSTCWVLGWRPRPSWGQCSDTDADRQEYVCVVVVWGRGVLMHTIYSDYRGLVGTSMPAAASIIGPIQLLTQRSGMCCHNRAVSAFMKKCVCVCVCVYIRTYKWM